MYSADDKGRRLMEHRMIMINGIAVGTYRGMHGGSVKGKPFEESRRTRKSHASRKAERSDYERRTYGSK